MGYIIVISNYITWKAWFVPEDLKTVVFSGMISSVSKVEDRTSHIFITDILWTLPGYNKTAEYGFSFFLHFQVRKTFLTLAFCDQCHKLLFQGLKCQMCACRYHQRCIEKVPQQCGHSDDLSAYGNTLTREQAKQYVTLYPLLFIRIARLLEDWWTFL